MIRAGSSTVPRKQVLSRRRAARQPVAAREAGLGSVGAQARRVSRALTALVFGCVVVGCFGAPRGVDCAQYTECSAATACSECFDVPGCGPLQLDRVAACEQSCPIAFECSVSMDCPAQIRCEGLVPGRRPLAGAVAPAPGG